MIGELRDRIALRLVESSDLAVASEVHGRCFDEPWKEKAIAELLSMPGSFGLFVMFEGQPTGLAIAHSLGAEGEVLTLCVIPGYRRRGFAAYLLAAVLTKLVQQGCQRVLLEVAADNIAARALYRNAGFAEIGRRTEYYRRGASLPMDAIVLASRISPGDSVSSGAQQE